MRRLRALLFFVRGLLPVGLRPLPRPEPARHVDGQHEDDGGHGPRGDAEQLAAEVHEAEHGHHAEDGYRPLERLFHGSVALVYRLGVLFDELLVLLVADDEDRQHDGDKGEVAVVAVGVGDNVADADEAQAHADGDHDDADDAHADLLVYVALHEELLVDAEDHRR